VAAAVVVGVAAIQVPGLGTPEGDLAIGAGSAGAPPPAPTPTAGPVWRCSDLEDLPDELTPPERTALSAYRRTAAAVLDPAGAHFDPAEIRTGNGYMRSSFCDPETDQLLVDRLGVKLGWTEGAALGVVQVEVTASDAYDEPQTLSSHQGWRVYDGPLPAGVTAARVTRYDESGGGKAVVAERADGLTVAVDVSGIFGNNAWPDAQAVVGLPNAKRLLKLAARPELELPGH